MNKKIILAAPLLTGLFILMLFSCDKKVGRVPVTVTTPVAASACDTVTYIKHIKGIMDTKCLSCHFPGNGRALLGNYAQVKAVADNGQLKGYVIDGDPEFMPQGTQLPANEKNLIICWLNNGKKE